MFYCDDSHVPSGEFAAEIGADLFRVFYGALFWLDFPSSVSYVPDVAFRSAVSAVSARGGARTSTDLARRHTSAISTNREAYPFLISPKRRG
jgi:hypothetical protein